MIKESYSNETSTIIKNETALLSLLDKKIGGKTGNDITIICAGHFLLMPDLNKTKLLPAIFDKEIEYEAYFDIVKSMIGIFPNYTWELAAKLVSSNRGNKSKNLISLLINDWQLVPPDLNRTDLSRPNIYREGFYKEFKNLPEVYSSILNKYNLQENDVLFKSKSGEFYLKEVALRDRFMRNAKNMVYENNSSTKVGQCSLCLDDAGCLTMMNEDNIRHTLASNSKAGCAAGISQMIIDVYKQFIREYSSITFINFMPQGCLQPVNVASELALNMIQMFGEEKEIEILNIYLDGSNTKTSEDFYSKRVMCYNFTNQ